MLSLIIRLLKDGFEELTKIPAPFSEPKSGLLELKYPPVIVKSEIVLFSEKGKMITFVS